MAKRKPFSLAVDERRDESGREIERLFASQATAAERPTVRDLPVDRIQPNPYQARKTFADIDELARSIRTLGFVSRLRVRPHPDAPDQFQLVYGERRLRAAIAAGLTTVPCEIAPHPDAALLEIGLAENIQRQDLNPIEEGQAFKRFIEEHGYTQQRLADRIGKDINYVNRRLKLLETPPDVQELVAERPDTIVVAREIARLPSPEERQPLIAEVLRGELSTRDVQARLRETSVPQDSAPTAPTSAGQPAQFEPASPASTVRETPPVVAGAGAITLDRDMRAVRRIFASWNRQVPQLDDAHYAQLLTFMDEHLQEVQRLMASLEDR